DDRAAFQIDPSQPFRIELGRGSGWHGLNTVKVTQDGAVLLYRQNAQESGWEQTSLTLSPEALKAILEAVEANKLLHLERAYHANVADGTQWVLWIQQGAQEKSVYFNNHFPAEIQRFVQQLDQALVQGGLRQSNWKPVAAAASRAHEKELWASIRR